MQAIPYNDRAPAAAQNEPPAVVQTATRTEVHSSKIPQPEISIIVDGESAFKPGMKSVFVEDDSSVVIGDSKLDGGSYCTCNSVSVCTCNMVCTCESVCTCQSVCTCVGHCTCNQVCTCESDCSCNQVCTCNSQCTCQSHSSGGTTYCSCVPVH